MRRGVVSVKSSVIADILHLNSEAAYNLLLHSSNQIEYKQLLGAGEGRTEGKAGTHFLRVAGFSNMIAFRPVLAAVSGLELYLEYGQFFPITTPDGAFLIWHHVAEGSLNVLDKSSVEPDGRVIMPRFLPHRLPGFCSLFTTPECRNTHLFIQAELSKLPSDLGGSTENDTPPEPLCPEDWRSLVLEAKWRSWTGLEFQLVWKED